MRRTRNGTDEPAPLRLAWSETYTAFASSSIVIEPR